MGIIQVKQNLMERNSPFDASAGLFRAKGEGILIEKRGQL